MVHIVAGLALCVQLYADIHRVCGHICQRFERLDSGGEQTGLSTNSIGVSKEYSWLSKKRIWGVVESNDECIQAHWVSCKQ